MAAAAVSGPGAGGPGEDGHLPPALLVLAGLERLERPVKGSVRRSPDGRAVHRGRVVVAVGPGVDDVVPGVGGAQAGVVPGDDDEDAVELGAVGRLPAGVPQEVGRHPAQGGDGAQGDGAQLDRRRPRCSRRWRPGRRPRTPPGRPWPRCPGCSCGRAPGAAACPRPPGWQAGAPAVSEPLWPPWAASGRRTKKPRICCRLSEVFQLGMSLALSTWL